MEVTPDARKTIQRTDLSYFIEKKINDLELRRYSLRMAKAREEAVLRSFEVEAAREIDPSRRSSQSV